VSAALDSIGRDGLRDRVADILVDQVGDRHDSAKQIARWARATSAAARNWVRKRNAPDLFNSLMLAREIPQLRDELCRFMGVEDVDPIKAERELAAIRERLDRMHADYQRQAMARKGEG